MLIENVEALKTWLVQTLTPICDADPGALAKYVVALVKKDKTEQELKEVCSDQLEVFLQNKTKTFVDQLFESLESKEYVKQAALVVQQTPTVVTEATTTTTTSTTQVTADNESKTEIKKKEDTSVKQINKDTDKDKDSKKKLSRTPSPRRGSRDLRHRLEDRRLYRRRSRSPRGRRGPRSRSRSPRIRSRSPNRSRSPGFRRRSPRYRSRSPRNRSRSPRNRSLSPRNRSLSPRKSPGSPRNRSRSPRNRSRSPRNWSKSPRRSPRPRSRSWSRSRSLSRSRSWSRSRSRSRSPRRRRALPDSRGSTPTQDNGRYGPSSIPTIGGVYSLAHSDSRYTMESTARGNARPRCIDYDEKGFCMRGDLCPFDHGLDPVIVEDVSIPPPPFSGPPPAGGPRMNGPRFMPPGMSGPGQRPPMPPMGPRPEHFDTYNPEAPAIDARPPPFWAGPRGPPPPGPHIPPPGGPPIPPASFMAQQPPPPLQSRQRDLVSIQTMPAESADKKDDQQIAPPGTEPFEPKPAEPQKTSPTPPEPTRTVLAPKRSYDAMEGQQHQRYPHSYGPPQAKKPFDFSRVGGYRKPGANNSNCALVIKNIPKEYNNIGKLNEHFGKFGTIVNLQINLNGDPDASLVTMSSNAEAYAAYKSSEPVFNNRFIKVFWHKPEAANPDNDSNDKNEGSHPGTDQPHIKSRLGPIPHPSKLSLDNTKPKPTTTADTTPTEKSLIYTSSVGNITKTVYNPNIIKAKAAIASPTAVDTASFVSKIEAIKRQEDLKKEALKKKEELQKQKQQLLTKQLEQQKMLIQKLEKNKNMSAEDKAKIMETLKALSGTIEKTKGAVTPTKPAVVPAAEAAPLKSPDEARKEILDTELELFTKQHSGEDTTELKKKLADLTAQAALMGLLGRGRGRGRGSFPRGRGATTWVAKGLARGRGRGAPFPSNQPAGGSMSLDKRPKVLDVTGFTLEDKDLILPHFAQFATVEKVDFDETTLTATVGFKTRMDAEKALIRGATYQSKQLVMKWHINVEPKVTINLNISSDDSFTGEGVDPLEEGAGVVEDLDEDELLAIDDEEEDVEESRSWRR